MRDASWGWKLLTLGMMAATALIMWGIKLLIDRRTLRQAVERHAAEIQAFVSWFLDVEMVRDRGAVSEVSIHPGGTCVFVHLKRGGWFVLMREVRSDRSAYMFEVADVDGLIIDHFPPHGLRCHEPWFREGMAAMWGFVGRWQAVHEDQAQT